MLAAIDSRDYIVAFRLYSADDCPPDFHLPPALAGFEAGLFLPRDDPDWLGRSSYPPRLLLLKGRRLYLIAHPATGGPTVECPMDAICSVESGYMLLKGWLRFTGLGFDHTVRYNTRGFRAVFRFIERFRDELLKGARAYAAPELRLGASLDIKFSNALSQELDRGERAATQFFQPPRELKSKRWLIPRHRLLAGDLLALTGRRLIWITDRDRRSYSRYGSITSYAPLSAVAGMEATADGSGHLLQVDLNGGNHWRIPIAPESLGDARDFVDVAGARCNSNRRT